MKLRFNIKPSKLVSFIRKHGNDEDIETLDTMLEEGCDVSDLENLYLYCKGRDGDDGYNTD